MIDKDKFEKEAKDVFEKEVKPKIDKAKMTAVEWFFKELDNWDLTLEELFNQAKEMENSRSQEYAEFAIRCDRMGMKILNFEDWIKL
jgi:hypothetical protein